MVNDIKNSSDNARENRNSPRLRLLSSLPPATPRSVEISWPEILSESNPYVEVIHRSNERAVKMERLEADLETERKRRITAEAFVADLIDMIPVIEEPSG